MRRCDTNYYFLLLLFCAPLAANGGNILFFVMPQSASHRRSMYPFAEALADRGHSVTFFSEQAFEDGVRCKHPNVTNRVSLVKHDNPGFYDLWVHKNSTSFREIQWKTHSDYPLVWNVYWGMMIDMCRLTLAQQPEEIRRLLQRPDGGKWDLIVIDGIFAACGTVITKAIGAPYVILNPTCVTASEAAHRSVPYPAATFPQIASPLGYSHKRFRHRMHAAVNYVFEYALPYSWDRSLAEITQALMPELLRNSDAASDQSSSAYVTWLYANPQFEISDLPSILEYPIPRLPDMAVIGGNCHGRLATLSNDTEDQKEWLDFVSDPSSKGTILLSFGHLVQWAMAPKEIVEQMFAAFDQFPEYRIAFQFNGVAAGSGRPHVKLASWLPVPGILQHPKTKLHVTHGGAKSLTESICASVPMVVLPLFAEQLRNADTIERIGAGLALDKLHLTTKRIAATMRTVLVEDEKYRRRVRELKSMMVDRVTKSSTDVGVFWSEMAMTRWRKEKGGLQAKFFKHKGRHLSWAVYFNIDVIAALLTGLVLILSAVVILSKRAWKSFS